MKGVSLLVAGAIAALVSSSTLTAQPTLRPVRIFAAGSLTAPLTAVAEVLKRERQIAIDFTFGPSGLLRQRLERREPADLFASANMEHPQALGRAGVSGKTVLFTRNALCAFARPDVGVSSLTLLDRVLDPAVKLGTSTPVTDPAGDYTWEMFHKADVLRPGAFATLDRKAQKLFGGPPMVPPPPPVPPGRNATAYHLETRTVDIYLQYCSGRALFLSDSPSLLVVPFPASLAVGADYGMTLLDGGNPEAAAVAAFIVSPEGQQIFANAGFEAVTQTRRP